MSLPFRPVLIAVAMVTASGAAHAQTVYVQESYNPAVSEPIAVTPVERTTVYRNIFPQGPGVAPIIRERVVTERFAPDPVRTRVVVQPRETVVVGPSGYDYANYGVAPRDYGYNYGYEVVTQPVVTERVVRVPAPAYAVRNNYPVRDAYARVAGPAREVVYEVDAAPRLTCKQRYRSYDPVSGTYLGYDGLRHPCR
jgi:hypothetical protein